MSLATYLARGAAEMIAKNEGYAEPTETHLAHAEWAIAGFLKAWNERGSGTSPAPVLPEPRHDGGGNVIESGPTAIGGPKEVLAKQSKAMGYTGDPCDTCGNFTLVRNGTCLKCNTCGGTTGCS